MRSAARVVAAALAGTVLLSGCLRVEMAFEFHEDGTGDFAAEFVFNTDTLTEMAEAFGMPADEMGEMTSDELFAEMDTDDPCADFGTGLDDYGVTREEIADGGEVGVRCSVQGVPIDEFSGFDDEFNMSVDVSDDGTVFLMELAGVSEMYGGEDTVPLPGFDMNELITFEVSATAPGSLGDNNATSTDGNRATWSLNPEAEFVSGDVATMSAEWSSDSGSSSDWLIPLLIALVALAVVVGVVFAVRNRKGSDDDGDAAESPLEPAAAAPASAPPSATPPPPPPPDADPGGSGDLPPPTPG